MSVQDAQGVIKATNYFVDGQNVVQETTTNHQNQDVEKYTYLADLAKHDDAGVSVTASLLRLHAAEAGSGGPAGYGIGSIQHNELVLVRPGSGRGTIN